MTTILATKLHQPALTEKLVQRPALTRRLNEGLQAGRQFTLVSAPAGFGKTTCVSEWLRGLNMPFAWLSLDKADDDPERFLAYFTAALQKIDPNIGLELSSMLASGQIPAAESGVASLINDILQTGSPFLLILDDFHLIQDSLILAWMERIISYQPHNFHLALITREDPALPLARLRASDRMTEIRANDLRFNSAEIGRFLKNGMDVALSDEHIAALEDRTEGWVVGVQLAGLSMRGRDDPAAVVTSLSGSHRFILSYLTEEVIGRLPPDVQDFLLKTSILERLTGELCDALTGRSDSSQVLEQLVKANLFLIPLDDEQCWYRYHHLFADLLRSQFKRTVKDQAAQLHRHASRWYEQAGMFNEAMDHALAGEDYALAVNLLESYSMSMILKGYAKTVEGWMQAIPVEWQSQSLRSSLAACWMYILRGSYEKLAPHLKQIESILSTMQANPADAKPEEVAALQAEWLALQANLLNVQGNVGQSIEMAQRALQLAPENNHYLRGLTYMGLGGAYRLAGDYPNLVEAYQKSIFHSRRSENFLSEMLSTSALTLMAIRHGKLHSAVEYGAQVIERKQQIGALPPLAAGTVHGAFGMVYYEWNQLDKAREHLHHSLRLSELAGHNAGVAYNKCHMAWLEQLEGNDEQAAYSIREAVDLLALGAPAWIIPEVYAMQIYIHLAQGNFAAAEDVLLQQSYNEQAPVTHLSENLHLANLRLKLFQLREKRMPVEDARQAFELAGRILSAALHAQRLGIVLRTLLLRAQLNMETGNQPAALDDLQQALEIAEPEGYIRAFVDEGAVIAALLRHSLAHSSNNGYAQQLLVHFPVQPAALPHPAGQEMPLDALTEREVDVLRLMAQGLKYEEIAAKLFISVNTVRFYVKDIYRKLLVNNRTQAIEAARQLGLL
jgi:LuxR family maltose regulon positive regulatory protein